MPRESKKVSIDKTQFSLYKKLGDGFYQGALAEKDSERWNASGVLIVHAAIAYADTVTIKYGGVKSKGDNHLEVVRVIDNLLPDSDAKNNALNQLERLIAHKTTVSYSGEVYDKADIDKLLKHLERFKSWVEKQISD